MCERERDREREREREREVMFALFRYVLRGERIEGEIRCVQNGRPLYSRWM